MSIIAEFRLSGRTALQHALSNAPDVTMELERSVGGDDGVASFLWGFGGDLDALEAALPDDPTVAEWRVVDRMDDSRLYRILIPYDAAPNLAPLEREVGGSRLSIRATAKGTERRMRFPDTDAMSAYFEGVRERHDLEVTLHRVYNTDENPTVGRHGLSEKQRDALLAANEAGYFSVPRETDLGTVADRLDISRQAASERIRRGTKLLVDKVLVEKSPG